MQVPNGAAGWYLLGRINRLTGRQARAVEFYCKALQLDPMLWVAFSELCMLGGARHGVWSTQTAVFLSFGSWSMSACVFVVILVLLATLVCFGELELSCVPGGHVLCWSAGAPEKTSQFCDPSQLAALQERLAGQTQQQQQQDSKQQQQEQEHIQPGQTPSGEADWAGDGAVPMSTSPAAAPRYVDELCRQQGVFRCCVLAGRRAASASSSTSYCGCGGHVCLVHTHPAQRCRAASDVNHQTCCCLRA